MSVKLMKFGEYAANWFIPILGRNVCDLYIYPPTPHGTLPLPSLKLIKLYKPHECLIPITLYKILQVLKYIKFVHKLS